MDILKDKQSKSYDYTSRYAAFPFYFNTEDKKYIYGLTRQLKADIPSVKVAVNLSTTLDALANKYYGRPDYWWVIADFNRIQDPFIQLSDYFTHLYIPSIAAIEFED